MKKLILAMVLVCTGGAIASAAEMSGSGQNMFAPEDRRILPAAKWHDGQPDAVEGLHDFRRSGEPASTR